MARSSDTGRDWRADMTSRFGASDTVSRFMLGHTGTHGASPADWNEAA